MGRYFPGRAIHSGITSSAITVYGSQPGWRSGHHPRLPPLWPRFDPGLVRGLWLVDLNLTPKVFLGFSSFLTFPPKSVSPSLLFTSPWLGRLGNHFWMSLLSKFYRRFLMDVRLCRYCVLTSVVLLLIIWSNRSRPLMTSLWFTLRPFSNLCSSP